MKRVTKVLLSTVIVGLLAIGLIAAPSSAEPVAELSACTPATNIEAIVDDSGSMSASDSNKLRVQALSLLIGTLAPKTTLGAVEFGSDFLGRPAAETLFAPQSVGPNATAMRTALKEKIQDDNGATDYNAAFARSDADNPNASARIFLTDGAHNADTYTEAHLARNVPTYVVGFGTGLTAPEDQGRLEKIANDTGGTYYSLQDASQLQSVMNSIGAALTCQTPPRQFTDQLAQGQSKPHGVAVGGSTKSLQIALTWANPLDAFTISGVKLVSGKKVLAVAARPGKKQKPAKLKVIREGSPTFLVLKVSGLRKGRLVFKVKATKVGSGTPKATLTTQVGQISRRK
jgi:hypothetical protein